MVLMEDLKLTTYTLSIDTTEKHLIIHRVTHVDFTALYVPALLKVECENNETHWIAMNTILHAKQTPSN